MLRITLPICHACRRTCGVPPVNGARACPYDDAGESIVEHGIAYACPLGKFPIDPTPVPIPSNGPGTHLRAILKKFGINTPPTCQCAKRAALMDAMGPDWCAENMEEIAGWLAGEARERGWLMRALARPMILRRLVGLAISRAQRDAKRS